MIKEILKTYTEFNRYFASDDELDEMTESVICDNEYRQEIMQSMVENGYSELKTSLEMALI